MAAIGGQRGRPRVCPVPGLPVAHAEYLSSLHASAHLQNGDDVTTAVCRGLGHTAFALME